MRWPRQKQRACNLPTLLTSSLTGKPTSGWELSVSEMLLDVQTTLELVSASKGSADPSSARTLWSKALDVYSVVWASRQLV